MGCCIKLTRYFNRMRVNKSCILVYTTENVAGIASMAKALRLVTDKEEFSLPKIAKMKKIIFDELAKYEDITIFSGEGEDFAPNILTFGIKGVQYQKQ